MKEYHIKCPYCHRVWLVESNDPDIILEPWPHLICVCHNWIPLF